MKLYLIRGVFFQGSAYLDWHGTFVLQKEGSQITGEIRDRSGDALVSEVALDEEAGTLSFVKRYLLQRNSVLCRFARRPDGVWEGTYSGSAADVDAARCVLTLVGNDFFVPPAIRPVSTS